MSEGSGSLRIRISASTMNEKALRLIGIFRDPSGGGLSPVPAFGSGSQSNAPHDPDSNCAIQIRRDSALAVSDSPTSSAARMFSIVEGGRCIDSEILPAGMKVGDVISGLGGEADVYVLIPADSVHEATCNGRPEDTPCYETADISLHGLNLSLTRVAGKQGCAVEAIHDIARFLHAESCGRCLFCREGTLHLRQMHEDIISGRGCIKDLDLMAEVGRNMKAHCLCTYGKVAAHLVLFGIEQHRDDYEHHINSVACPAGGANGAG